MNNEFSKKLANLRKEKKQSQKNAAKALGVSQALLSHYERGIREYGLGFLKRACEYYDVSADYILGLTDRRKKLSESSFDILQSDTDPSIDILRRLSINVCKNAGIENNEIEDYILKLSALNAYRLSLTLADKSEEERDFLARALITESLLETCILQQNKAQTGEDKAKNKSPNPDDLNSLIGLCEGLLEDSLTTKNKKDKAKS